MLFHRVVLAFSKVRAGAQRFHHVWRRQGAVIADPLSLASVALRLLPLLRALEQLLAPKGRDDAAAAALVARPSPER
jgi:hypothetical protein